MAYPADVRMHTRSSSHHKTTTNNRKSQAKPLFAILVSIVILSYAVFAESIGAPADESSNTTRQITKIADLVFGTFGLSAILALENGAPVENQEILFYSNGSRVSGGITDSGGTASANYSPAPGTYNILASFNGTEYLYPSNLSRMVVVENVTNPNEIENIIDSCIGVTCESLCNGTVLLKNGYCNNETNGCEYEFAENSSECGYPTHSEIKMIMDLALSSNSVIKGEIVIIRARLSYENSTQIPDEALMFYEDSVFIGSNITDESGIAWLSLNTSGSVAGNITINATHNGIWNASVIEILPENATYSEADAVQGAAEIGKPVRWTKWVSVRNNRNRAAMMPVAILVDEMAQDVEVNDKSGKKIDKKHAGISAMSAHGKQEIEFDGNLAPLEEKEYELSYSTPSPEKYEGENRTDGKAWRKNVTIFSDYSYTNVLAYTDVSETDAKQIHLFWNINGSLADVTEDTTINLTYADTNGNGKIDRIYWTVPHLSEQEFVVVVDLTVINVQSYPTVGGNWNVIFTTTGTANLRISAIDGTTFGNNLPNDLEFLDLTCGSTSLKKELAFNAGGNILTYYDLYATREEITARIAELNETINGMNDE